MKHFKFSIFLSCALFVAMSPLRAETPAKNSIESINVMQQGNEVAVKIDFHDSCRRRLLVSPLLILRRLRLIFLVFQTRRERLPSLLMKAICVA